MRLVTLSFVALRASSRPLPTHPSRRPSHDPDPTLPPTQEGKLELFDLGASTREHVEDAHEGPVWSIAPLPDRTGVVTGSADKTVKFWQWKVVVSAEGSKKLRCVHLSIFPLSPIVIFMSMLVPVFVNTMEHSLGRSVFVCCLGGHSLDSTHGNVEHLTSALSDCSTLAR
jgi:WD40 repeat protein